MKMTRQQVADLLLNMNEDLSNVEFYSVLYQKWINIGTNDIYHLLTGIANNGCYRIKDNSVKEVTPALEGK